MNAALSPLVSEFETTQQEASYTSWLHARVSSSLADTEPSIPHDQVMAELDVLLSEIGRKTAQSRPSS